MANKTAWFHCVPRREWLWLAGLTVGFLLLAGFDLPVSLYMTQHASSVLVFFGARIGLLPACSCGAWCAAVLSIKAGPKKKALLMLITIGLSCYAVHQLLQLPLASQGWLEGLIGLGLAVLLRKLAAADCWQTPAALQAVRAGLWILIVSTVNVNILKCLWGRPRFFTLSDPLTQFQPWYRITGIVLRDDLHKSFPSGHTTAASMILWLTLLPQAMPKLKEKQGLLWSIALLWIALTAIGRIQAGAHYLSDVSAAFILTLAITWLGQHHYFPAVCDKTEKL